MKRLAKSTAGTLTLAVVMISLNFTHPLIAQVKSDPSMEKANQFFQTQDWQNAAKAYKEITKQDLSSGQAWYRLGYSLHNLKQYKQATLAYEQAEKLQFAPQFTKYNLACTYSLMNEKTKAFESLDRAIEAGFSQVQSLKTDPELENLRDDSRFNQVVEKADKNARPCEYDTRYRQFDFWIGDWDVYTPQGKKAGTNSIQKISNGCALLENWTGAGGGSGKSINYYNPSICKWVQVWVDGGGGILPIEGEFKDGSMHFEGTHISMDLKKELFRGTWSPLPDGSVRQFLERSRDNGKTWYVWFDGKYVRQKEETNNTGSR